MIYIDTNIFIYAIENHPKYGKACKKILEDIESEKLKAASSVLVLVEIINVITKLNKILKKEGKKMLDLKQNVEAILSLPITWIDLNFLIVERASEYTYDINGVDYIHAATMDINSINEIISADEDLDKVKTIKRIGPLDYM
jgi:predicted nucleic acid-binding protein